MAQRSHVPAFGNWESEGNVPYTVFFDKARKGKGGGPIRNPNDPEEYPEMFSSSTELEAPPKSKSDTPVPAMDPLLKASDGNNRGKTRMKPQSHRDDDTPEGTAVPKFGSWDVNNPASADGFTHIFGKVREEKMMRPGTPIASSSPYNNNNNNNVVHNTKPKGCGCFPWLRK